MRSSSILGALCSLVLVLSACEDKPNQPAEQPSSGSDPEAASAGKPAASAAAAGSSSQAAASATSQAKPKAPPEPLNVMLLTVDSLRQDMPWTGYERKIAPNLTELAAKSTVYPRAYSVSSYTAKSVATMLTSRYPSSLYRTGTFFAGYSKANLFVSEVLQDKGIRTMGGHGHMYFGRGKDLEQGFDIWEVVKGLKFDSTTDNNVTSDKMTDMAIEMLSNPDNTKGQFFMWFHYMDPHDQYIQHEESPTWGKNNRDRYDSEVFFTDLHIGRLFDFGKKQDWWDKTAIIISADHGEAFGEHGMYKHAFALWEVLTRVPLVIYAPGADPQVIEQRRSHIDLAPTILELMGIKEMPESFKGKSMVSEVYGASEPDNREPIVLDLPEDTNNPDRHAIIAGDYKLMVYGRPGASFALYNLAKDPGEESDLSKKEPEKLKEMQALYDKTWEAHDVFLPYGGSKLRSGKTAKGPSGPTGD